MTRPALFARCDVHEPTHGAEYATIRIRVATEDGPHPVRSWHIEAQRSALASAGRWWDAGESRDWSIVTEADRIVGDPARAAWDIVGPYGAPYACRIEGPAYGGAAWAAWAAALPPREPDTLGQLLHALRTSRRVAWRERWRLVRLAGDPVDLDAIGDIVPGTGAALRWAERSSAVLAARAAIAQRAADAAAARERERC